MANLITHFANHPSIRVQTVIAYDLSCPAAQRAIELGVTPRRVDDRSPEFGSKLNDMLQQERIDLVCLAGYMRLLPASFVGKWEGRILNIHPALLPKFGGKGMYGMNVHQAVIAAGEHESGCTIHFVTEQYDEGAPVLQMRCPVQPDDTPEDLASRVLTLEHKAYPLAVEKVLDG